MDNLKRRSSKNIRVKKIFSVIMTLILTAGMFFTMPLDGEHNAYAASVSATGKIDAGGGAYMRKSTSTSSGKVMLVKNNTKVTIIQEVFNKKSSTKRTDRWYYISASGKKGYVRSDLVDSITYANVKGTVTDALNYRVGAGTGMKKAGTLKKGTSVTVLLPAKQASSKTVWYRVKIGKSSYYVSGDYVKLESTTAAAPTEPEEQPAADTNAKTDTNTTTTAPAEKTEATTQETAQPAGPANISVSGASQPTLLYTGQAFTVKGKVSSNQPITKVTAGVTDASGEWVISQTADDLNATSFDLAKLDRNLKFGTLKAGDYKYRVDVYSGETCSTKVDKEFKVSPSEVAVKLSQKATSGGSARIVYTFNKSNCTKLFSVTGYGSAYVPQGMAYADGKYYIVFGMSNSQAIVTFSDKGKRLKSTKYGYNMGHPNAMTYDPVTKLCYIFRGSQYKVHTWNPATNKFSSMKLSYSNSGVAYDNVTGELYCTSKTGVRVYSADGKFTHKKLFSRCSHSGKTYVQDCGAARGYVFHGVSGANKHSTNYLDVYRVSDGKYLGTIKVNLDETESVTIDDKGFVVLLVNTKKKTDYVYRTPLNVNDLP